jgi:hypothetical protein
MLFYRYLKFFLDMGIRMVRGPEPIRAPDRHRCDGMEGKIEIDPMITHTMPLPDIDKGFELMHGGKSIRSVVVY